MTPVIELRQLGRVFPSNPPVVALRDVSLTVESGEYVSIVGPSGSGKSTLLNVIGCLDRHTSGVYSFDGIDVASLSDGERAGLRGGRIGFVFQAFHLVPHRDIVENVMLAELYNRALRKGRRERSIEALRRVGLGHRLGFLPGTLSGGERQRVAIARALVHSPALLLCDEPTGNLDTRNSTAVLDLFDDLHRDGLTLLVITHDPAVSQRAQRVLRLVDGTLSVDAGMAVAEAGHVATS